MSNQIGVPSAFFWRRMHSLMGLWLVIFLIEHLLTNSQAALWVGDDGSGFVRAVNAIQGLPYLHFIELFLLGVPFFIHIVWGIKYLRTGKINSIPSDGTSPSLTEYPRNHAYTWQRITSWILVFAVVVHVTQMRFINYPSSAQLGHQEYYMVKLSLDEGLYTVANRLKVKLYDEKLINLQRLQWEENGQETKLSAGFFGTFLESFSGLFSKPSEGEIDESRRVELLKIQDKQQQLAFLDALETRGLEPGEVIAVAPDFGTAELLVVRETFKMPMMLFLYSLFVLAATFHAFNGLWTCLITWGVSLTERAQKMMRKVSVTLMILLAFLGLSAIWGTYLVTLNT